MSLSTLSAPFRVVVVTGLVVTGLVSGMLWPCGLWAQQKFPEMPKENLRASATIKAVAPGMLHVVTAKGDQLYVKVEAGPQDVIYTASASVSWLRPGMLVRFNGHFNKKGQAREPISELTVFTPREGLKIGVFADAGLGGGELFASDEPKQKKPAAAQYMPFLVAGQLTGLRNDKITVAAGGTSVKAELAKDATVRVDISDYRLARAGDSVQLEGWYYPDRKNQIYAKRLTINAAKPLGEEKEKKPVPANPSDPAAGGDVKKESAEVDKEE